MYYARHAQTKKNDIGNEGHMLQTDTPPSSSHCSAAYRCYRPLGEALGQVKNAFRPAQFRDFLLDSAKWVLGTQMTPDHDSQNTTLRVPAKEHGS
jgi:hypothetical protein